MMNIESKIKYFPIQIALSCKVDSDENYILKKEMIFKNLCDIEGEKTKMFVFFYKNDFRN